MINVPPHHKGKQEHLSISSFFLSQTNPKILLRDNFGQATQNKIKKAILYDKMKINIANYCGTNMMPKTKAPLHSHKNPVIDCRYCSVAMPI